jgi:molybdopterin synthase catalytic subunit
MTIVIRLFASLRERAGVDRLTLEVRDSTTIEQLLLRLRDVHPELFPAADRAALAVNLEYVPSAHELKHGDELALIPPVSGG